MDQGSVVLSGQAEALDEAAVQARLMVLRGHRRWPKRWMI